MRILWSIPLVLLLVPPWSGEPRLALPGTNRTVVATPVALDPANPRRRQLGSLTYLGGVALRGPDEAFGGFSSVAVAGDRFTLLSDGGNIVSFMLRDWRPSDARFATLPAGPGTGWSKRDRDSEAMTTDLTGRVWVAFERANAIARYAPGFARMEAIVMPPAMADWPENGGPEAMARLRDGRTIVIAEKRRLAAGKTRDALLFADDPVANPRAALRFGYQPPRGYDPSDVAALPDGRLLVLNRCFTLPYRFSNKLTIVDTDAIRPGAIIAGREIATLAAPLLHDNFEGVAVTREGPATIVWLVSDDNQSWPLQRSYLLKFRLNTPAAAAAR